MHLLKLGSQLICTAVLASSMASSENASAACAETSTEVSELVSDSTDEDADMLIRLSISRIIKNNGQHLQE